MSLLGGLVKFLEDLIATVGYPGLFVLMVAEGIVTPIPSEAIVPFAGSLAAEAGRGFWLPAVILVATAGATVGAVGAYYIGQRLGRAFVLRFGRVFGLNAWHLGEAERWFAKHGRKGIFLGHALPGVRSFISFPAGMGKMPVRQFALYTFGGALVWNTVLAVAGYLFVNDFEQLANTMEVVDYAAIGASVAAILGFFLWRRSRRRASRDGSGTGRPYMKGQDSNKDPPGGLHK
jgi:membrane protein DedA with SNARE-associated domain